MCENSSSVDIFGCTRGMAVGGVGTHSETDAA